MTTPMAMAKTAENTSDAIYGPLFLSRIQRKDRIVSSRITPMSTQIMSSRFITRKLGL